MYFGVISNSPKINFSQIKIFFKKYIKVFKNICEKLIFGEFEITPMKNILIKNKINMYSNISE
jgi:hypothetical protein